MSASGLVVTITLTVTILLLSALLYMDQVVTAIKFVYSTVPQCGQNINSEWSQWIKITDTQNHKTAYGLTRDKCPGCGAGDLGIFK